MIWDEIYLKGCCDTLEDIVAYTKAGSGRWCPITNPSGRCCREYLEPLVKDILEVLPHEAKMQGQRVIGSINAEPVVEPMRLVELKVYGMTCEGCAASVTNVLENLGGKRVRVSLKEGKAEALFTLSVTYDDIIKAIEESGYSAEILKETRIT
jgi:copper chaperone CopZ